MVALSSALCLSFSIPGTNRYTISFLNENYFVLYKLVLIVNCDIWYDTTEASTENQDICMYVHTYIKFNISEANRIQNVTTCNTI